MQLLDFRLATEIKGGKPMCLTNTADVIDYSNLTPAQKRKINAMKRKLRAHRKVLKKRLDDLDKGLRKLERKSR